MARKQHKHPQLRGDQHLVLRGDIWHGSYWTTNEFGDRKRVRFSTGETDCCKAADALAARAHRAAEAPAGLSPDATGKTVEDALRYLVEHSQSRDWADSTVEMFGQKAGHLLRLLRTCQGCAAGGDMQIAELCASVHASIQLVALRRAHVKRYIDIRLSEGAARESVRKELSTLRVALTEAADLGWMIEAAAFAVFPRGFKSDSKVRERWLPGDEYTKLLDALDTKTKRLKTAELVRRRRFVTFGCFTGAELSVLETVMWPDIDFTKKTVRLRGTKFASRDRTIPLAPELEAELSTIPESERTGLVLGAWPNARRDLGQACERAGIEAVTPHTFRHTFASWLVQKGEALIVVARLLGQVVRVHGADSGSLPGPAGDRHQDRVVI